MTEKKSVRVPVVAGVVIKKDGKYLLLQEKKQKAFRLWNFPAGQVDEGETIEEAAIREAQEEAGIRVRLIRKLDIFQDSISTPPKHAFEAEIIEGKVAFDEEDFFDAQWFTPDEIRGMNDKLRSTWVLEAMEIMEQITKK